MHKVIVERPRLLRGGWTNRKSSARLSVTQCATALDAPDDFDSGPKRASSARHGKWLNENLAPLRRYLMKQVGRPWDKVYSEICSTIDTRSAVGLHVLQHLEDFVSLNTFLEDGVVCDRNYGRVSPVKGLYVHPVTKLLRCTKNWRLRKKKHFPPEKQELKFVRVGDLLAYEKIEGLWFRVAYRRVEPSEPYTAPYLEPIRKQQCDRKAIQRIERGEMGKLIAGR
jgi:hypothetical protein